MNATAQSFTKTNVAHTILRQLGGGRFLPMTGAKNLVGSADALSFRLPGTITKNHINYVRIRLEPDDTYTVAFGKIRGLQHTLLVEREDVYCDNLRDVFTTETGLDTHL
jgi:hypothetical protein